jgi:alkylated DNA repair dioxygenase AlkB
MIQPELFSAELPHGLVYCPDFLNADEEAALLGHIQELGFRQARFQQYTARRRVVRFGSDYVPSLVQDKDEDKENDFPRIDFPSFLLALRERVAAFTGIPAGRFEHGLVTEYQPGTPIGWHRDAPYHETVVGISLANAVRMRFRPMPARGRVADKRETIALTLQPRSLYVMRDEIRWNWQHHIPPVKALRYSITFRTQCQDAARPWTM